MKWHRRSEMSGHVFSDATQQLSTRFWGGADPPPPRTQVFVGLFRRNMFSGAFGAGPLRTKFSSGGDQLS